MAWHIVQKLVEGTGTHSTLIGKFWITLFFVIRFLLIVSIAKNTWSSNQGDFVCNTKSPGCHQVCFNAFNPITPISFWSFQLLAVAIASIVFNIYTTHKLALVTKALQKKKKFKALEKEKKKALKQIIDGDEGENKTEVTEKKEEKKEEKKDDKKDDDVVATKLSSEHPTKLYLAYFAMVLFRLLLEVGFMVAQYFLYSYKFVIPELFQCQHWPCPNVVDCFVSRPKEKTIMLCSFYATGCIMVALNIMELLQLTGKVSHAWSMRHIDVTKEVFGDEEGPQFDMPRGMRNWGPGAEGVYAVQPSGYPDAVGIPMLYQYDGPRPKRSRFSRRR